MGPSGISTLSFFTTEICQGTSTQLNEMLSPDDIHQVSLYDQRQQMPLLMGKFLKFKSSWWFQPI